MNIGEICSAINPDLFTRDLIIFQSSGRIRANNFITSYTYLHNPMYWSNIQNTSREVKNPSLILQRKRRVVLYTINLSLSNLNTPKHVTIQRIVNTCKLHRDNHTIFMKTLRQSFLPSSILPRQLMKQQQQKQHAVIGIRICLE